MRRLECTPGLTRNALSVLERVLWSLQVVVGSAIVRRLGDEGRVALLLILYCLSGSIRHSSHQCYGNFSQLSSAVNLASIYWAPTILGPCKPLVRCSLIASGVTCWRGFKWTTGTLSSSSILSDFCSSFECSAIFAEVQELQFCSRGVYFVLLSIGSSAANRNTCQRDAFPSDYRFLEIRFSSPRGAW